MSRHYSFHIHGDNIVECERTLELITESLGDEVDVVVGPLGSPVCPEYTIRIRGAERELHFTFFPGFGRWDLDINGLIRERGARLREAADAVISGVDRGIEEPLVAIEYCGALPAGNQAWQRNGRAYSFGLAKVPYVYVAELGGYELDSDRKLKAPRMPNPAVPFSYISFSMQKGTPVLPAFITSPGADDESRTEHASEFSDVELRQFIRSVLLAKDVSDVQSAMQYKALSLVRKRADAARKGKTLTSDEWTGAYRVLDDEGSLVDFLVEEPRLSWSKTAYIAALTDSARALMKGTSALAVGLTSSELPMCIVEADQRQDFSNFVTTIYQDLPEAFRKWLSRDAHLVICWVMGFKPKGDDARPDRGLPPLVRMLVGDDEDLLTIVYGPATPSTWPLLHADPLELQRRNGLWEAIFAVSDAILVDSATDEDVTGRGYVRSHWDFEDIEPEAQLPILVSPAPTSVGENDIDTVLHNVLAKYAGVDSFEGMCNPPGGDWSGVSLLSLDRTEELRWLSLPRVSGPDTKRPDHVFQIFDTILRRPVILSIESKETPQAVEKAIGPRLSAYISNLIDSTASIGRVPGTREWSHSNSRIHAKDFVFVSAVAFISQSARHAQRVLERAEADLLLEFSFGKAGASCSIQLKPASPNGVAIAHYLSEIDLSNSGISVFRS